MTDGVSDEQFETAIDEAKDEGNLSRANVVRKVQGAGGPKVHASQQIDEIRKLAGRSQPRSASRESFSSTVLDGTALVAVQSGTVVWARS